jgi:small redox-active disulfide protein 2
MSTETRHIKILGSGCESCRNLEQHARRAADELGIAAVVEHVTDPAEIASWGVMRTPGLVIDDDVVASGRVASVDDVKGFLG